MPVDPLPGWVLPAGGAREGVAPASGTASQAHCVLLQSMVRGCQGPCGSSAPPNPSYQSATFLNFLILLYSVLSFLYPVIYVLFHGFVLLPSKRIFLPSRK